MQGKVPAGNCLTVSLAMKVLGCASASATTRHAPSANHNLQLVGATVAQEGNCASATTGHASIVHYDLQPTNLSDTRKKLRKRIQDLQLATSTDTGKELRKRNQRRSAADLSQIIFTCANKGFCMQKHGFAPIGAHFEEICSISAGNRCQLHKTIMHCLTSLPGDPWKLFFKLMGSGLAGAHSPPA